MDMPRTRLVLLIVARGLIRGHDTGSPGHAGVHTFLVWTRYVHVRAAADTLKTPADTPHLPPPYPYIT